MHVHSSTQTRATSSQKRMEGTGTFAHLGAMFCQPVPGSPTAQGNLETSPRSQCTKKHSQKGKVEVSIHFHDLMTKCHLGQKGQCPCLKTLTEPRIQSSPDSLFLCRLSSTEKRKKKVVKKALKSAKKNGVEGLAKDALCEGYPM